MSFLQPRNKDGINEKRVIAALKKQVARVRHKFDSPAALFTSIRGNFSRLELMIIDSALKNMSMDNLDRTLLLKHDQYFELCQSVTDKLKPL
jgi:hypothetical protein